MVVESRRDAGRHLGQSVNLGTLVDLSRYPISNGFDLADRTLVEVCRAQLAQNGVCVLKDFMRPAAVAAAVADLQDRLADAYYCENTHNPYLAADDPGYPPDHPRNRPQVSDLGCLADDRIPDRSSLRVLYQSPDLRGFIAAVLGVERLYPYADPLGSLNVNVFRPGQQLGWHFDNADYAITVMLQSATTGGVYEYVPFARSADDDNYETITAVLDGDRRRIRQLAMGPGALVLFRGRYSLHRVTPVEGTRPRLVAVLSYDT
ncbi:MAG: HalD/BesD family halogenase, partial [Gammaproteobacteria bacterium]